MAKKEVKDVLIDLVDENNNVIGQEWRSKVLKEGKNNFRLACSFVKDEETGKYLVPRRIKEKERYPDAFGVVGGCVQSGETYDQAMERELRERIGLEPHQYTYRTVGYRSPYTDGVKGYVAVYELTTKKDAVKPNPDYYSEVFWYTPDQIHDALEAGEKTTQNFPLLYTYYFEL